MQPFFSGISLDVTPQIDADGMVIDELERTGAAAVVLTPSHQFPTGVALSPARRMQVVDWARRTGAVIVEDDYIVFTFDGQEWGRITRDDVGEGITEDCWAASL